jgi:hypothetical protein
MPLCPRRAVELSRRLPGRPWKSFWLMNSRRSSPVSARLWSIFPVLVLRRRPGRPPVRRIQNVAVAPPLQRRHRRLLLLQAIQVFQEQQPGGLFGVIEPLVQPASFHRTSSMFLKTCSNEKLWKGRNDCNLKNLQGLPRRGWVRDGDRWNPAPFPNPGSDS